MNDFNIKQFLVENKMTRNSRLLSENTSREEEIRKIINDKVRQWRMAAGAQSVMIDDMPEEVIDDIMNKFRDEAESELGNLNEEFSALTQEQVDNLYYQYPELENPSASWFHKHFKPLGDEDGGDIETYKASIGGEEYKVEINTITGKENWYNMEASADIKPENGSVGEDEFFDIYFKAKREVPDAGNALETLYLNSNSSDDGVSIPTSKIKAVLIDYDLENLLQTSMGLNEAKKVNKVKEIEEAGRKAALEAKLAKVDELMNSTNERLTRIDEDEEFTEMMDKTKVKEIRKELKLLEKMRAKIEKAYGKVKGKEVEDEPIIDEYADAGEEGNVDEMFDQEGVNPIYHPDGSTLQERFKKLANLNQLKG